MDDQLLTLLRSVDTPTVCNAIEVAEGKRGFDAYTRGTVLTSDPTAPAIVGYARTARISATAPPTEDPATIKSRRMAYYRYMAEAPAPAITVIEDVDRHPQGLRSFRRADQRRDARPWRPCFRLPGHRRVNRSQPRLRPCPRD